jgi:hypothetical protein
MNRLLDVMEIKIVMLEKILVSSLRISKLGYIITCCFHSFYCKLQASELRSTVTSTMGIFIAGVNQTFENISLMLLIKWNIKYNL